MYLIGIFASPLPYLLLIGVYLSGFAFFNMKATAGCQDAPSGLVTSACQSFSCFEEGFGNRSVAVVDNLFGDVACRVVEEGFGKGFSEGIVEGIEKGLFRSDCYNLQPGTPASALTITAEPYPHTVANWYCEHIPASIQESPSCIRPPPLVF